jgi:uncharacterized membrane protein YdbT with pleckstrin-like domain
MHSTIEHTDEDELKLCEVAKHPFGIIILYIQATVGVILGVGLAYFLIPSVLEDTDSAFVIANIFAFVTVTLAIMVVVLASVVYKQNRIIVTDRNITQILQFGLFNRKVSQLNMVNVEDVTSVQNGFLSTIFGFGDLNIETAGEQANFHFTYCPRPGYYAKVILNAREEILGQHDGDHSVVPGPTTTR